MSSPAKIGLIAGWGRFPWAVAERLQQSGTEIYGLGIKDHADPELAKLCTRWEWVGLAKLGQSIRFLKRNGVQDATMAGKVFKVRLYQRWAWLQHLPDWRGLTTFWPHFVSARKDRKDDTLLLTIVNAFAQEGITLAPATDYAPELLVSAGQLSKRSPTAAQWKDIHFGWKLAKEMGRLDIGQSVVIKDQTAIAIEAIEGTDECIRRAGQLCTSGGFTLVKTAKPQQDMRFDVPTVGLGTLQTLVQAGGKVLAIEAGKTILVEQAEFLEYADANNLVVVAIDQPGEPSVE
jgi:UDP-2,3-diacylglucosamine hydrolase